MATKRPIGPPMRGRTPEDEERMRRQFDKLVSLVPRDMAEKLMKEILNEVDKQIQKNSVPKEIAPLINQIKKSLGIRKCKLPKLSKKEEGQWLKCETNNFIRELARGWLNTLLLLTEKLDQMVCLDDELLLPTNPNKEIFEELETYNFGQKINSWLDIAMSPTITLIPKGKQNQAIEVYKAFIENVKKEIEKSNNKEFPFYEEVHKNLIVGIDNIGYFLKIVSKS